MVIRSPSNSQNLRRSRRSPRAPTLDGAHNAHAVFLASMLVKRGALLDTPSRDSSRGDEGSLIGQRG